MKILGIDPGTADTGYGVIEVKGKECKKLDFGTIKTKPSEEMGDRLVHIHKEIQRVAQEFKPDLAVIEDLFFFRNAKSVMAVSQARGVIICALTQKKVKTMSYTPLQIKQTLTGYGRAEKKEVQSAVRKVLRMRKLPKPNHAADALAAAICYVIKTKK
jgi:crossover junction endodeoxyribonuclease RuvC